LHFEFFLVFSEIFGILEEVKLFLKISYKKYHIKYKYHYNIKVIYYLHIILVTIGFLVGGFKD